MTANPQRRIAAISLAVAVFFIVLIFIPGLVGIDGFEGGFAISFVSIIVAAVAFIVGAMYLSWASKLDGILRGEGILAHWFFTQQHWAKFANEDVKEDYSEKKALFILVSGIALFFGLLFWAFDAEAGFFVFLIMLALIGLCAFVWQASAWNNRRQNLNPTPEVFISKDAIYMNKKFYTWKAFLTRFNGVTVENHRGLDLLVFRYTQYNRFGTQTYTTRVPIPPGQEICARIVAEQINELN